MTIVACRSSRGVGDTLSGEGVTLLAGWEGGLPGASLLGGARDT